MKLEVFKILKKATLPTKATEQSSCYDLHSCLHGSNVSVYYKGGKGEKRIETDASGNRTIAVHSRERVAVPTGLILNIPDGYDVRVYPRSGMSLKNGITLSNSVGVIDNDYKEELFVTVINNSDDVFIIEDGMRIAQFELNKTQSLTITETETKPEQTTDRNGGLGSTGEKEMNTKHDTDKKQTDAASEKRANTRDAIAPKSDGVETVVKPTENAETKNKSTTK